MLQDIKHTKFMCPTPYNVQCTKTVSATIRKLFLACKTMERMTNIQLIEIDRFWKLHTAQYGKKLL